MPLLPSGMRCHNDTEVRDPMSNADDAKGRLKEAAGDLTDDKDLRREGKVDRAGEPRRRSSTTPLTR